MKILIKCPTDGSKRTYYTNYEDIEIEVPDSVSIKEMILDNDGITLNIIKYYNFVESDYDEIIKGLFEAISNYTKEIFK